LALPLVGLSLHVHGGCREAAVGRPHVARLDGPRVSLLVAAAADPARVVRRATAIPAAHCRNSRHFSRRAGQCVSYLSATSNTRHGCRLRVVVSIFHRADRQLQFLQSAHDAVVRLSIRRRCATAGHRPADRVAGTWSCAATGALGNGHRDDARSDRGAARVEPDLADVSAEGFAGARCGYSGCFAMVYR
jgi:hypothetical protein